MKKNLNPEIIPDNPNFHKFMQVYENEEDQALILAKKSKCALSFLHSRYKKITNTNKMPHFPSVITTFKT